MISSRLRCENLFEKKFHAYPLEFHKSLKLYKKYPNLDNNTLPDLDTSLGVWVRGGQINLQPLEKYITMINVYLHTGQQYIRWFGVNINGQRW
jgi:hypothetical protein